MEKSSLVMSDIAGSCCHVGMCVCVSVMDKASDTGMTRQDVIKHEIAADQTRLDEDNYCSYQLILRLFPSSSFS